MRMVLYGRTSTSDQTISHQRAQAEAAGYVIDHIVFDEGVSGVTTRLSERPEGRRLFDILRHGDTLLVRWVDRLGRDYRDVSDTIREFMRRGVVVRTVINGMVFDGATRDPMQQAVRDALIGFMAASAEAQATAAKEAQRAGIQHAKGREGSYLGRKPTYSRSDVELVHAKKLEGFDVSSIARVTTLSRQTVYRILSDKDAALNRLDRWSND